MQVEMSIILLLLLSLIFFSHAAFYFPHFWLLTPMNWIRMDGHCNYNDDKWFSIRIK